MAWASFLTRLSSLQSIRDQMATSLARLKELEEEVKQIPVLQVKVNVLKEEKKLLLDQVRGLARGEDRPPLLLPPSLEGDLTDLSEDELETRLASLRSGPARRRRSESPLRVNLEEFKSYRRARRGSLSEGSEAESMAGDDYPLRITEPQDPQRRPAPPRRLGHEPAYSLPGTPLMGRRKSRDAATSCRVLTRDVGVTHVGARTRSVGLMASSEEEPCAECKERGHRSFQDKGVATEPQEDNRRRLSVKSVSTESIGPEEAEQEGAPSKNSFLAKLGRKSAIISRLSEPQLVPPALTFDNSTNTEPVVRRDQACGTSLSGARLYTPADLAQHMARAKEEWEAAERTRQQLARSSRPLTLDRGTQATLDLPTPPKTTFRPLMQSVGSQVQPRSVDVGVGVARITDDPCPRCSGLRTRSVACGSSVPPATPAPSTPPVRTRSVASGELALHDPCCPDRPAPPRRSVGCSLDRLTDRLCDHCDNLRVRSVGVGTPPPPPTPVPPPPVEKPKPPPMHSTHTQTRPPSTRTASVNTAPLPIKKEEAAPPSPAGTPEVERRAFGSSGVRVCDKCHEAITSVAKDIVGTSGSTSLPPLPPPASKIPRLVDITKVEPRLDPPRPDSRASEGSHPDSQPSSLASQPEVRPSMVPQRSGLTPPRTLKTEPTFAQTHTTSSTASKITTEAKVTAATATLPKIQVTRVNQTLPEPAVKERPTTTATATAATTTTTTSQDSTTQSSEGIVNLGFEDHKPTAQKHAASVGTSTQGSTLTTITESTKKSLTTDTTTTITSTTTAATKTHKQKTDTKEDNTSRKTSESEAVAAAVIQGKGSEASESSSNESESEDEGGAVPSREMKAALKVLNDSIGKPVRSGQQLTNALNIVQREWLKVSSQKDADPHAVEDYMDAFEDYSKNLLQKVVNLADVNGNTAMHYAVSHGNFDVVSVLLDSKVCNVNQQNKAGYTATMLVSLAQIRSQTHASVVQRLFQLGDLNIKASQHGQTALMLAVSHGRLDMVQMLVAAGAEINIQDDDGSTALMCAAEHGHLAIVKFLLAQPDTDPTLMDNDGSTALTIAVEAGHRDVGVLLYKHLNLSRGSSPYSSVR
ncbi:KN motif and ankyrin repeat domain-containing protein 1 [Portunus trituberculatus]|uniref:KN motif and ankyrin repeat domain-containing protein 1 n=1 Tax=Portunus trituberculatus TaxID=210409 RepID=A0A5B7FDD7_PORTR|nr:KN motif and ankyrin repeat domain-containing protein 1 [Portunus trituberculatus]